MTTPVGNMTLCMDDRMLRAAGTGISSYARALRAAQVQLSSRAVLLGGGAAAAPDRLQARTGQLRRRARAVLPLATRARVDPDGFNRPDLFRLGHAFFLVHRRLLPIRLPGPPGIVHWSYPLPLRAVGWRNLYTIHDSIPLTQPELSPIDSARHRRLLRLIADTADALVTISRSAAAEIAAALAIPVERLVDCSQPVDVVPPQDGAALPAGLVPGRYLLVCGTVEPRKNVARIVAAYRASGIDLPLVVAGPDGWRSEPISAMLHATPGVIRLPYQSRAAMLALMGNARALVMPSLAEGFGLPVAEAMAMGIPVITANTGALAETAQGAALSVDPIDTAMIAAAMGAIVRDDELARRLGEAGQRRARAFVAPVFVERLRALYNRFAD